MAMPIKRFGHDIKPYNMVIKRCQRNVFVKRDFERIFHDTLSRWLLQKRLHESYFLLNKKGRKPSDIYIELGFEDLSHSSFAFKKLFGITPTSLSRK